MLRQSRTNGTNTAYSYDPDGNLQTRNVTIGHVTTDSTYSWDVPGRLLKAGNDTGVQGYHAYDGLGRRVKAKEGSSVTFYSYRGAETLSDQFTSGTSNDYVYADGLRIARTGTYVSTYYYHTDAVGSTRLVTDANRNIAFSDNYQPFGQDNSSSGSETYRFTGKPVSATTGLYYYGARWYDPSTGRFISQDPFAGRLSDPQSLNPYVYVENTPTSYTDPTGEFILIDTLIGAGVGAAVGYGWCVAATGGWTSSTCGEYTLLGAGTGALAGTTWGLSLAFEVGCEAEDCIPPPPDDTGGNDITTPATGCQCPELGGSGEGQSSTPTTPTITTTSPEIVSPTVTSSVTNSMVDTSSFFAGTDLIANTIDSNTFVGLDNGFPVPSSSVPSLLREWVGPNAASGPSGTGIRYFSEPSPGVLQQARVDYGQIGQEQGVFRVVLETYVNSEIQFKIHLPIIG